MGKAVWVWVGVVVNMSISTSIEGVRKELLGPGKGSPITYEKNSKAVFHFRTIRLSADGLMPNNITDDCVIDDTRTLGNGPFELLIGREFKLGVLEKFVKEMLIGELSRFICPYKLVSEYPTLSKALRELAKRKRPGYRDDPSERSHTHQCGFSAIVHGSGHIDLDTLIQDMPPIAFEIELIRVESPGSYKQETWAMTDNEKLQVIPGLKEEGNVYYKAKEYEKAADKYREGLEHLESLSIKEKPQSEEWNKLEAMKVPFLLNYSQCMLLLQDYAEVIRQTTKVLEFDPTCVKALYRRGKAYSASWNIKDATLDLQKAAELDTSLRKTVDTELLQLTERLKIKNDEEMKRFKGKLF